MAPYYQNYEYTEKTFQSPPEGFLHMDSKGLIQDENGIPILYHRYRRANVKSINYNNESTDLRFNVKTAYNDSTERHNLQKYWWLDK